MAPTQTNETDTPKRKNNPTRTRQDILDVALSEFVEQGYSGARVDAIAGKTKTSKRMLYYYFRDKEGLYRAVLRAAYNNIREAEKALDVSGLSPDEGLRRLVRFTMDYHAGNPEYVRLIMIENIHHGRFINQLDDIVSLNEGAIEVLTGIYRSGCDKRLFRTNINPIDLHWLISALAFFSVSNKATFNLLFQMNGNDQNPMATGNVAEDVVLRFVTL